MGVSSIAIKIMLVDDHAVVREGYRTLLQKQPGLEIVAEARDGEEAYRLFKAALPGLVIIDISMPGLGGIEAIKRIRSWDPTARILVFTMHLNAVYALQAIRAGAKGYVTKSSPPDILVGAVFDVNKGKTALSPDISRELALTRLGQEPNRLDGLTPREFEILRMLVSEQTTEQIAGVLNLSAKTVANTHYLIKSKLGVSSDIELVRLALRYGLVDLAELGMHTCGYPPVG
jgi:DNA-binding NarL/FixJ family response regulator